MHGRMRLEAPEFSGRESTTPACAACKCMPQVWKLTSGQQGQVDGRALSAIGLLLIMKKQGPHHAAAHQYRAPANSNECHLVPSTQLTQHSRCAHQVQLPVVSGGSKTKQTQSLPLLIPYSVAYIVLRTLENVPTGLFCCEV